MDSKNYIFHVYPDYPWKLFQIIALKLLGKLFVLPVEACKLLKRPKKVQKKTKEYKKVLKIPKSTKKLPKRTINYHKVIYITKKVL